MKIGYEKNYPERKSKKKLSFADNVQHFSSQLITMMMTTKVIMPCDMSGVLRVIYQS